MGINNGGSPETLLQQGPESTPEEAEYFLAEKG